ncbi:MAG TPA: hypothetical protein VNS57_11570, partial [Steroidobacteraceae bacterium]|nr:hypothetical protein [Steroidobacteraceae bacterium]
MTRSPWIRDHFLVCDGLVQRDRQFAPQPVARHVQHVHGGVAVGGFEELARAAGDVEDLAAPVDQQAGARTVGEHRALGDLTQVAGVVAGRRRPFVTPLGLRQGRHEVGQRMPQRATLARCARVQLPLAVGDVEQARTLADRLRGAEEQRAAGHQRVVEQRDQLALQVAIEIDQQVATADQVELRERRVLDHVLLREDKQVAQVLLDPVGAPLGVVREKAREPLLRDVGRDARRVNARARLLDGLAVDVGREHLDLDRLLVRDDLLVEQDRDRVRLLAGRAAADPDPHHVVVVLLGEQLRQHFLLELRESVRVAEEVRDADQQVAEQRLDFLRVLARIAQVVVRLRDLVQGHAPLDPPQQRRLLVLREVVPGLGAQLHADALEQAVPQRGRRHRVGAAEGMPDVLDQLRRHFRRWQHEVDHAGRDRAARHAVVFGGVRGLRDAQAAFALDRSQAERAVAARARHDDADRALVLRAGERKEEVVDRETRLALFVVRRQVQRAVDDLEVVPRRDHVRAVGLELHAVLGLEDPHARVTTHQFDQHARVVRREVLHEHERHAARLVGGHRGEERLERGDAAGGGADADDRKARCHARDLHLRRLALRFGYRRPDVGAGLLLRHVRRLRQFPGGVLTPRAPAAAAAVRVPACVRETLRTLPSRRGCR